MTGKLQVGVCLCPEAKERKKRPLLSNAIFQDVLHITHSLPINLAAL